MNAMRNASDVTLNTIPKLKKTSLRFAFVSVKELKMENASMLENNDELSEVKRRTDELIKKREEELRERRENGIVLNADDLESLPACVKSITVNACEDYKKEVLDLSRFNELETLKIGRDTFKGDEKKKSVFVMKSESIPLN